MFQLGGRAGSTIPIVSLYVFLANLAIDINGWVRLIALQVQLIFWFLIFFHVILFIFKIYLFIYLLAALGFCCCARAFSSCGERGLLFIVVHELLIAVLLLLRSTGSRHAGFSSCGMRAQKLWLTGPVVPRHVGSSRTRARIRVPCIGRWILNHCATRGVPLPCNFKCSFKDF